MRFSVFYVAIYFYMNILLNLSIYKLFSDVKYFELKNVFDNLFSELFDIEILLIF